MAPKAVLVGLPGSGKSTIGRRLAKALNVTMLDTDVAVEQQTGRRIADIFATDGEKEFRRIEEEVVKAALAEHDGVLSLGGGAVTSPGVRAALAGHTVVFLEINATEGVRRTGGNTVRPLLAGPDRAEKFRALMSQRVPLYRQVASIRVNTNRRNPGAVVRHIIARLENPHSRPRRRRRPTWGRSPISLTPTETTQTPPSPAALAARCDRQVALADGFGKLLFALLHLADQSLIAGFFMFGGPEDHFGQDGSEIEALGGQNVNQLSAVGGIFFRGDDAVSEQSFQAIGEDVGGDSFVRGEEFLEGAETSQHHVA